jgi:hypothetical protein
MNPHGNGKSARVVLPDELALPSVKIFFVAAWMADVAIAG